MRSRICRNLTTEITDFFSSLLFSSLLLCLSTPAPLFQIGCVRFFLAHDFLLSSSYVGESDSCGSFPLYCTVRAEFNSRCDPKANVREL